MDDETGLVAQGDAYWTIVRVDGVSRLVRMSESDMSRRLATPVSYDAGTEPRLAQLGLGIGVVSGRPFNHFAAGDDPEVRVRF
ncbi:hypothetical protein Q8G46_27960, partial [Klebsiella pneumoniae]|uniref:hypothetical protein n=1 Tax=Klebsiella pneumoniae TaxID=573 RepID=UPI003013C1CB